ncbi:Transcriptional regulatory protein LiaR [compost metagenome]|nr:LuxR C-terminal-related transcriptional regulator [Pseudomonas putida]
MNITERERDVMLLVGQGKTNKQIGLDLGISHNTVRDHVSSLFKKLNVKSRTELAILLATSAIQQPAHAKLAATEPILPKE